MKFLYFVVALILAFAMFETVESDCAIPCPMNYSPVCAEYNGVRETFSNECIIRVDNCLRGAAFVKVSDGDC